MLNLDATVTALVATVDVVYLILSLVKAFRSPTRIILEYYPIRFFVDRPPSSWSAPLFLLRRYIFSSPSAQLARSGHVQSPFPFAPTS